MRSCIVGFLTRKGGRSAGVGVWRMGVVDMVDMVDMVDLRKLRNANSGWYLSGMRFSSVSFGRL